MFSPPSFLWISGPQNPAMSPAQKRQARDHQVAQRAAAYGQALNRFPVVRDPIDEEVVRSRAGIHPPNAGQGLKLPDAVQLQHRSGRKIREFLVVCRFECERSLPGDERAPARDGTSVEIHAQHEELAATEGGSRYLLEIAPAALRRGERGAAQSLPAARLDTQELLDPTPGVVLRTQYEVLDSAALTQAPLLAPQPAAQVARYRRLRIAFLFVSTAPQATREDVGRPAQQSELVGQIDQLLVEWSVPGDALQLDKGSACLLRSEPAEQRYQALAGGIRAQQRRAHIAVDVLPETQRGHFEISEIADPFQRKQATQLHRSARVVCVVSEHQDDPDVLFGPERFQRRQQYPVLVKDVGFDRRCREFFPGRNESRQRLQVVHHDDGGPASG